MHWHHKLPKYKGGTNDINNLVLLRRDVHSKLHKLRFYLFGDKRELWAAQALGSKVNQSGKNNPMFGKYGKDNPNYGKKRSKESCRKMSETRIQRGIAKGKNNPMFGIKLLGSKNGMYGKTHTKEARLKIGLASKIRAKHEPWGQQLRTCDHCGFTTTTGNHGRWHGNNCKHKGVK